MTSVILFLNYLLSSSPGDHTPSYLRKQTKPPIRAVRWSARRGPCLEIPSPEVNKLCIGCDILKTIFHVLLAPVLDYSLVHCDICRSARGSIRGPDLFCISIAEIVQSSRTSFTTVFVIGSKVDSLS